MESTHKRTPFKAYGDCPKMDGFVSYDQDRTAKVQLCHIARNPRKVMLNSDFGFIDYLLTLFRRFTIGEVQRVGRIFVRNLVEQVRSEPELDEIDDDYISVFDKDNTNQGFFNDDELEELDEIDGING